MEAKCHEERHIGWSDCLLLGAERVPLQVHSVQGCKMQSSSLITNTTKMYFLSFLKFGNPKSICQQNWIQFKTFYYTDDNFHPWSSHYSFFVCTFWCFFSVSKFLLAPYVGEQYLNRGAGDNGRGKQANRNSAMLEYCAHGILSLTVL